MMVTGPFCIRFLSADKEVDERTLRGGRILPDREDTRFREEDRFNDFFEDFLVGILFYLILLFCLLYKKY
jgi:hypothetical protein